MYAPPPLPLRDILLWGALGVALGVGALAWLPAQSFGPLMTAITRGTPAALDPDPRTAAHLLKSARVTLNAKRKGRRTAHDQPFDGWTLSLYVPPERTARRCCGPTCPREAHPPRRISAHLRGGLTAGIEALWVQLSPAERRRLGSATFKVDQLAFAAPISDDGGWDGAELTLGRDGVQLVDDDGAVYQYLAAWGLEAGLGRRDLIGAARAEAVAAGWTPERAEDASVYALRTHAWVERFGGVTPLALGLPELPLEAVDAPLIRARALSAARYLARETCPNGWITYEYDPRQDLEPEGYNAVRHAGATWAMLRAWRLTRDDQLLKAAQRALRWLTDHVHPDPRFEGERFVRYAGLSKLGASALTLCALIELEEGLPGSVRPEEMAGLAAHIARMQFEDGHFRSYYDWDRRGVPPLESALYPSEAIFALVRYYRFTQEAGWLAIAQWGVDHALKRRWRGAGLASRWAEDAWLTQALVEIDRTSKDTARTNHLLGVGALRLARQISTPEAGPLRGGEAWDEDLPDVMSTASGLEALAALAALEARRRPGEVRFKAAALEAARYVLSQQLIGDGLYATAHPIRARGGIPSWPGGPIHVDGVQHALVGLINLLEVLEARAP